MLRRLPVWAHCGFSIVDLMITVAVFATIMAMAVPAAVDAVDLMRLGMATRDVERELQTARLRAVSTNRPLRLRWNCPVTGQYRIVEITGNSTIDGDSNRCSDAATAFPYPAADNERTTLPNHDGPIRRLYSGVTVGGNDLMFLPNGTTQQVVSGAFQAITSEVTITVTRNADIKRITVNGLGKIKLE